MVKLQAQNLIWQCTIAICTLKRLPSHAVFTGLAFSCLNIGPKIDCTVLLDELDSDHYKNNFCLVDKNIVYYIRTGKIHDFIDEVGCFLTVKIINELLSVNKYYHNIL